MDGYGAPGFFANNHREDRASAREVEQAPQALLESTVLALR